MTFFRKGQLNTPNGILDDSRPGENDFANQSARGIPDNAFLTSKVAIHPYFLKYADLSRYCMQDVCIPFWREDGTEDMMLKTPTSAAPILTTRATAQSQQTSKMGDQFPQKKTWWFFVKCWADTQSLAQPAYQGPEANNWFTTPHLSNNFNWSQATGITGMEQYKINQIAYPKRGWPTYPIGAYNSKRDIATSPPITDWVA